MGKKTKIDLKQLEQEIEHLKWGTDLYLVLKRSLTKVDHWKQKARGNPVKAYNSRGKRANS